MAAPRNMKLDRFLAGKRCARGRAHTHTRIRNDDAKVAGGSFVVEEDAEETLRALYYKKVFTDKTAEHLTERQLPDEGPLLVDI